VLCGIFKRGSSFCNYRFLLVDVGFERVDFCIYVLNTSFDVVDIVLSVINL